MEGDRTKGKGLPELEQVAHAFGITSQGLTVIGKGTNPARTAAQIYCSKKSGSQPQRAYRCDRLSEASAEVALQLKYIPPPLNGLVKDQAAELARALFEWKVNLSRFFSQALGNPETHVVRTHRLRFLAPKDGLATDTVSLDAASDPDADGHVFVTEMELGTHTARELLLRRQCEGAGSSQEVANITQQNFGAENIPAVSLRKVLITWLSALNAVEIQYGLTYVDAHLDNFLLFETENDSQNGEPQSRSTVAGLPAAESRLKLIDLESLQPLGVTFAKSSLHQQRIKL